MVKISDIHDSLVNGQRRQMVKQIQEYGVYDFTTDYPEYLKGFYDEFEQMTWIVDATLSYLKITCK